MLGILNQSMISTASAQKLQMGVITIRSGEFYVCSVIYKSTNSLLT